MSNPTQQAPDWAMCAAAELHGEFSDEWWNECAKQNPVHREYYEKADARRREIAAIISKHAPAAQCEHGTPRPYACVDCETPSAQQPEKMGETPRCDAEFKSVSRKFLSPFEDGFNEAMSERCSPTANPYVNDSYAFTSVKHDAWNAGFSFGKRKRDFARTLERELNEALERINKRTERLHESEAICHKWCMENAALNQKLNEAIALVDSLLQDYEVDYGEGVCDCRPEPENAGQICNACRARAILQKDQPEKRGAR